MWALGYDVRDEGRDIFRWVVGLTAAAQLALVALLSVVEPATYYNEDLLRRGQRQLYAGRLAPNPEPKRPIPWAGRWELPHRVVVRSTAPLAPGELELITEVRQRAEALFTGWVGLTPRTLPGIEIRFVPLELLNDGDYFRVENDGGVYYGRFFPGDRIGYLTPLALEDERHLVHELAHFFTHEYDLDLTHAQEEAQARRFEETYTDFLVRRARPHVLAELPEPSPELLGLAPEKKGARGRARRPGGQPEWHHDRALNDRVAIKAGVFFTVDRWAWVHQTVALAEQAFPAHASVEPMPPGAPPPGPLTLYVPDWPPPGPERRRLLHGLYVEAPAAIWVSPGIFLEVEPLSHALAHHLVRRYGLELSEEEEEILCFTFEAAVERARRGEPVRRPEHIL